MGYSHIILTENIVSHLERCGFQSSLYYSLGVSSFLSICFHFYKTTVIVGFNLWFKIILHGSNTFFKYQTGMLRKITLHLLFLTVLICPLIFPGWHYCLWFTVLEWTNFLGFLIVLSFYFNMFPTYGSVNICENLVNFSMCLFYHALRNWRRKKSYGGSTELLVPWRTSFRPKYLFFTKTFISFLSN